MKPTKKQCFDAVANSLVEFGYPGVTGNMIGEVWEAMLLGDELPHDIVGAFAERQLSEHKSFIESLP